VAMGLMSLDLKKKESFSTVSENRVEWIYSGVFDTNEGRILKMFLKYTWDI